MPRSIQIRKWKWLLALAVCVQNFSANADDQSILVQSTTSTANSGLYEFLLPKFESHSGIKVNVVAVGTGQAIKNASNCDADVLLVHAKSAEEEFVTEGFGVQRHNLMYNDFVIVGPSNDPAEIKSRKTANEALAQLANSNTIFTSRGDNSGTHKKELALWQLTNVDPTKDSGKWYRETGSGMGATLNIAIGMNAYALTDRATWIKFKNRGQHEILFEGDEQLFNQYGVTLVNSKKCPHVKATDATEFVNWLVGSSGQQLIGEYKVNGQQLFYPNADL